MKEIEIVYLKMFNGEDIIAVVADEDKNHVIITNPIAIKTIVDGVNNTMISGFYPWIPIKGLMECRYTISKFNVVCMSEVPDRIKTLYQDFITRPDRMDDFMEDDAHADIDDYMMNENISRTVH